MLTVFTPTTIVGQTNTYVTQCSENEKKSKHSFFSSLAQRILSKLRTELIIGWSRRFENDGKIEANSTNKESMLTFRFGTSDKFIHLTQQQLDCITFLAALVTHKDDMSSTQNENSEYILNPPINYK